MYHVLGDPAVPLERRPALFMHWAAAYYAPAPSLAHVDLAYVQGRGEVCVPASPSSFSPSVPFTALPDLAEDSGEGKGDTSVEGRRRGSQRRSTLGADVKVKSSLDGMSAEDLVETADTSVWARSGQHLRAVPREIYHENVQRALFECDAGVLPRVDAVVLWSDSAPAVCLWAARDLWERIQAASANNSTDSAAPNGRGEGQKTAKRRSRRVRFGKLERANHFVSLSSVMSG